MTQQKFNPVAAQFLSERKTRSLTLREVAPLYGVSYNAAYLWESGKAEPTDTTLLNLVNSKCAWVGDLAFRCLLIRYPFILETLSRRARRVPSVKGTAA